jgi:hypothetical protein
MEHREHFITGLSLIAEAIDEMAARGLSRPVLVGGAAVELWTSSEVVTGDFDFVTENQAVFEEILQTKGFEKPGGIGMLQRGLHHAELLIGVEVVSGRVFDGNVPDDRLVMVSFDTGSLVVISVEDAIADRMGQYASHEASNEEMLGQAVTLLRIAVEIDRDYLDRRIRVETLNSYGLKFLEERVDEHARPYP